MSEKTLDNSVEEITKPTEGPDSSSGHIKEYVDLAELLVQYPWFTGNAPGQNALIKSVVEKEIPDHPMVVHNIYAEDALRETPLHLQRLYLKHTDPAEKVLEDARDDLNETIDVNLSPEFHSDIEDLKLLAAEIFGELANYGFLPFFNQQAVVDLLHKTKFLYMDVSTL